MSLHVAKSIVSGASGFVGRSLVSHLDAAPVQLRLGEDDWLEQVRAANYSGATVFHLAAKVHGSGADTEAAFVHDNVDKTVALAQAALDGGARRVVFLSSVKVNGEETTERPFRAADPPSPEDAYGRTKWQAEQALARISGMEVAIVRSPLVYGAGVKGNLLELMRLADSSLPLPFAGIDNRRSFVHVDDLARLLVECAVSTKAAGGTFMAAHPDCTSTTRLVQSIRRFLGRPPRLFHVPGAILEGLASVGAQRAKMRRLTRSLEIDASETQNALGWTPQIAFETSVEDMVRAYRESLG
ncbi:MAG TPA: NAD-dependent epimerase/dehydratase family protein [Usitatibacter sp.]